MESMDKKCYNCKHWSVSGYDYPCVYCWTNDEEKWTNWEAKEVNSGLECINAMELAFGVEAAFHFCVLNAYKHIWHWNNKNGKADLEKARWHLDCADSYMHSSPVELQDDTIKGYHASYMIANMRDYIQKCLENL